MSPTHLRTLRVLADHALLTGLRHRFNQVVTPQLLIKLLNYITDLKHPPKPPPIYTDYELQQRRTRTEDEARDDRREQRQQRNDHS